jgi:hypothetical protein
MVLYSPAAKLVSVVSPNDFECLSACTELETLSGDSGSLCRRFSQPATPDRIVDWLKSLLAAGLLCGTGQSRIAAPFFPSYRSEDGIFALMLARCREGSCIGHTPFTVQHSRPQRREYGDVLTVRMSDVVIAALGSCPVSIAETPEERLARFGKFLTFLGTRDDSQFQDWLQSTQLARVSNIAHIAQTVLSQDGYAPEYWAEDVAEVVGRIPQLVTEPAYFVPDEVKNSGGLETAKEIVRQFGELVSWWPAIVERTRQLAERDVRIGVPVGSLT